MKYFTGLENFYVAFTHDFIVFTRGSVHRVSFPEEITTQEKKKSDNKFEREKLRLR